MFGVARYFLFRFLEFFGVDGGLPAVGLTRILCESRTLADVDIARGRAFSLRGLRASIFDDNEVIFDECSELVLLMIKESIHKKNTQTHGVRKKKQPRWEFEREKNESFFKQ
jgi:hypothetical protein